MKSVFYSVVLGLFLLSCENKKSTTFNKETGIEEKVTPLITEIKSPANQNSSVSNLFIDEQNQVYLTWTESQKNQNSKLYFSTLTENTWSNPIKVSEGNNWVVNWADFTSLTKFGNNLVANILVESNPETYAYDVKLILSSDNGKTWGEPFLAHTDGTQTEHGFVSLIPIDDMHFMAVWLDGRKYETPAEEMTLRAAIFDENGQTTQEFILDKRVCDCCGTNAVMTPDGIAVIYRNRDENEMRDMSIVYYQNNEWTEPKLIAIDNWEIAGCPVNGPAIDAYESDLSIAWFTAANDTGIVKFVYNKGLGEEFSSPIQINEKSPIGRVDVCVINQNTSMVSWMEEDSLSSYLMIRTVKTDGSNQLGNPILITEMNGGRSSGFPKMVKKDNQLVITWTNVDEEKSISTVIVNLSEVEL